MKPLLLCLIALPAEAQNEPSSPGPSQVEPPSENRPLPRLKDSKLSPDAPSQGPFDPTGRIQGTPHDRRAQISEARRKYRERGRAQRETPKVENPEINLPTVSSSKKEMSGSWVLKEESFKESLNRQFQEAVGKGATFKIGNVSGNYRVTIAPELTHLTVDWQQWKMTSTSSRGDDKVTLSVSVRGQQEYEILQITEGKKVEQRRILMKLIEDKSVCESFFEGAKIPTKVKLPTIGNSYWSIHDGTLHIQGIAKETAWQFVRPAGL